MNFIYYEKKIFIRQIYIRYIYIYTYTYTYTYTHTYIIYIIYIIYICWRWARLKRTNLPVLGLSLNRSQRGSALLSTTPRLKPRSSTNDFALLHCMGWIVNFNPQDQVSEILFNGHSRWQYNRRGADAEARPIRHQAHVFLPPKAGARSYRYNYWTGF